MLQATGRVENAGVPAKGLTGQAYEGHYFWDMEMYVLPFLIYTQPRIARNVLKFRYGTLPKARERAREALSSSQYVGPAPVPLVQYRTWVEKQTIRNVHVTREVVREGFRGIRWIIWLTIVVFFFPFFWSRCFSSQRPPD